MKKCKNCDCEIPNFIEIDGKKRNLQNRKFCLDCSPFGEHNTKKDINSPKKKRGSYEYVKRYRQRLKSKAVEYKGGKCSCCGYNQCLHALEFHHLDPKEKDFSISSKMNSAFDALKTELDKCALVCRNCHAEIHAGLIDL